MDTTTPEALTVHVVMTGLKPAHATVIPLDGNRCSTGFGTVNQRVELIGERPVVRQLLTDSLAQLDAIEAGG